MSDHPQSGQEPPSGIQGKGTPDEPYDQGNQPEQTASSDVEPVAGKKGAGTVDEPYDQGNQPGLSNAGKTIRMNADLYVPENNDATSQLAKASVPKAA